MSQALPLLATGTMGAEEEARSIIGTVLAQALTLIRNIVSYVMEYMRKFLAWVGEHPLGATLLIANMAIWIS